MMPFLVLARVCKKPNQRQSTANMAISFTSLLHLYQQRRPPPRLPPRKKVIVHADEIPRLLKTLCTYVCLSSELISRECSPHEWVGYAATGQKKKLSAHEWGGYAATGQNWKKNPTPMPFDQVGPQ